MDEFHYIAVAGNQNSGQHKTEDQPIKWATDLLTKQSGIGKVYIYRVVEVVERHPPPIKIREIRFSEPTADIG